MKKREATAPGATRRAPAFLLAQLGAHAAIKFKERMGALGLMPPHAGILRTIGVSEGMSQKALAQSLGILPSRLVELLDDLSQRGFVERRDDADDRRVYALHLTKKGAQVLEAIRKIARDHEDDFLSALTPAERARLSELLGRVAEQQGLTYGVHPGFSRMGRKHGMPPSPARRPAQK